MKRTVLFPILAFCGLGLLAAPGCGEEEAPPAEQAEEGLDQFEDAVGNMESRAQRLDSTVEEQLSDLQSIAQKQYQLMQTQLEGFEERIVDLPAQQEQPFRDRHGSLQAQLDDFEGRLEGYSADADSGGWETIQSSLNELKSAFESFAEDLNEALGE